MNLRPLGPEAVSPARHGVPPLVSHSLSFDVSNASSVASLGGAKPNEMVRQEPVLRFLPGLSPGGALRQLPSLPASLLSVRDVAAVLGVSKATIYKLCDRGDLVHMRVSNTIRFRREEVERFLASCR